MGTDMHPMHPRVDPDAFGDDLSDSADPSLVLHRGGPLFSEAVAFNTTISTLALKNSAAAQKML